MGHELRLRGKNKGAGVLERGILFGVFVYFTCKKMQYNTKSSSSSRSLAVLSTFPFSILLRAINRGDLGIGARHA